METAREIISTFDSLPLAQQKEVTKLILRRNVDVETLSVSDEELILNAEERFLELDQREALDG